MTAVAVSTAGTVAALAAGPAAAGAPPRWRLRPGGTGTTTRARASYLFDADSSDPEPLRATFRYLADERRERFPAPW